MQGTSKGASMNNNHVDITMGKVDGNTTRRQIIVKYGDHIDTVDFDLRDVSPVSRALESLPLPLWEQETFNYILDVLNQWARDELINYLEATVNPDGHLIDLYDTIDQISRNYRAEFGGPACP